MLIIIIAWTCLLYGWSQRLFWSPQILSLQAGIHLAYQKAINVLQGREKYDKSSLFLPPGIILKNVNWKTQYGIIPEGMHAAHRLKSNQRSYLMFGQTHT